MVCVHMTTSPMALRPTWGAIGRSMRKMSKYLTYAPREEDTPATTRHLCQSLSSKRSAETRACCLPYCLNLFTRFIRSSQKHLCVLIPRRRDARFRISPAEEYPRELKDRRQSGLGIARIAHLLAGSQDWIAIGIVASGHLTAHGTVTRLPAVTNARAVAAAVPLGVSPHSHLRSGPQERRLAVR